MHLDTSGRLGIGTTSPSRELHISKTSGAIFRAQDSSGTNQYIEIYNSGGNTYYDSNNNGNGTHLFRGSGGTEYARIDSSGRLLVGTPSNSETSTVVLQGNSAGIGSGFSVLRMKCGSNAPSDGADLGYIAFNDSGTGESATIKASRDGGTWTSGSSLPTRLTFSTTPSGSATPVERVRIGNNGVHTIYSSTSALFIGSAGAAGTSESIINGYHSATSTTALGTLSFRVYTNGNVQNTNNSYTAISDIKLKENIVDAKSQWDDIKGLRVVNYNLKPETGAETYKQLGLIAQEVELVSPGLVSESPDRDADGNDLGTVTKSVNYSVLYMKAVKALQEAMERIEQLETEMAAVKAQLS